MIPGPYVKNYSHYNHHHMVFSVAEKQRGHLGDQCERKKELRQKYPVIATLRSIPYFWCHFQHPVILSSLKHIDKKHTY